jgi:excisionase family DNA binding protein
MGEPDAEPTCSNGPKQKGGFLKTRVPSASPAPILGSHIPADCSNGIANLLDEHEVADLLGISVKTLRTKRCTGESPPFFKVGRLVRYSEADVMEWLQQRRRRSTSDSGPETRGWGITRE